MSDEGKTSKAEARYGRGHPDSRCSLCAHYHAPSTCDVVAGAVRPSMWCRFFFRRGNGQ